MRILPALFLSTFLCTCVSAQTPDEAQPYGSEKSAEKMQGVMDIQALDALMYFVPGIGKNDRTEIMRQNIKSYMMPIRKAPSTRMEWSYALTSALEFYQNLNENFKENLSPDFLSMSLANQGTRPNMEDGLRLLIDQGTVSANIVPFGSDRIPGAVYSVPKIKINNFGYVFQEATQGRNRIFEVKKALTRGNPVLVELRTPAGFANFSGERFNANGPLSETHYLNVIGYDSATKTFELRGSFGRLWADAGYLRIGYDDFVEMSVKGYVLIPSLGAR